MLYYYKGGDRLRQLISIFNDVKRWFISLNTKRVLIILIIAALAIAPTLFAFGYVIQTEYLRQDSAFSVALYTDKNELIVYEDGNTDTQTKASVSDIFIGLTENPKPTDKIPSSDEKYIKAVITVNGASTELNCYFSTEGTKGYYTDSKGQTFIIPEELNRRFLATEHSELFYDSAVCYSLLTIDGDTILPNSTEWYYKNTSDSFSRATRNKLADGQKIYEITGALDILFPIAPDSCIVQVYQGDKRIYIGNEKDLSSLTVDSKEELRVIADAKWICSSDSESYGRITYDFFVHIKNSSSFYINAEEIRSGGFILLDCTNITDISKIKFESNKSEITPVFRRYNGAVRALIAFPESDKAEIFEFSVSYGASSRDFTVSILPSATSGEFSYGKEIFSSEATPKKLNESIKEILFSTPLPQNDVIYFRGNFIDPSKNGFSPAYTHNSTVLWGEELEYSYTAMGNKYTVSSEAVGGVSVTAIQNGAVAFVGNSKELGNYVVIDHGCGLRTWYAGLGNADVKVGDIVLAGQHIGKTGEGSIEGKEGFRLFCTVYDTMIDPNTLW